MATIRGLRRTGVFSSMESAGLSAPQVTSAGGALVGYPVTIWVQTRFIATGGTSEAKAVTGILATTAGVIVGHLTVVSTSTAWSGVLPYANVVLASSPLSADYANQTLVAWIAAPLPVAQPVLTAAETPIGSSILPWAEGYSLASVSFTVRTPPASSGGSSSGGSSGTGTGTSSGGSPSTGSSGSSSSSGSTPTVPTPTSAPVPTVLGMPQGTAILVAAGTVAAAGIAIAVAAGGR